MPGKKIPASSSASPALAEALQLCYTLRLNEAERALKKILAVNPISDDVHCALALIRMMQGSPDQQRTILERTLNRNPTHYLSLHQIALAQFRAGQFGDAYKYIRLALGQKPNNTSSLLLASRLSLVLGNHSEAYDLAEQALRQSNGWQPQACNLMAEALIMSEEPEALYKKLVASIAHGSGDEVELNAVCRLAQSLQCVDQCLILCDQKLTIHPDNKLLRLLRIKLFISTSHYDDCFPDLYYLLSLEPTNPLILYSLAETLLALKQYRESLRIYLRIARITGTDCLLLNQIGACYRYTSQFRSAMKAYWRSIKINPIDATVIGNLGELSFRLGDPNRSLELYSISLNLNPIFKPAFYNAMLGLSVGPPKSISSMLKQADYFWTTYRSLHVSNEPKPLEGAEVRAEIKSLTNASKSTKARIGILSADIGNHCVSYFLASFLKHYTKDRFHVELILCDRRYEDRERQMCSYADHALSLEGLSEHNARETIRNRQYDLIIESNGYTSGTGISILAERCAPIQCHYIGYHASTGLDTIDYFISDHHILDPSVTGQLSEKPLRLDRAWLAFHAFEEFPAALSTAKVDRPILGFFGNSTKITGATLDYWSSLFQACPQAILALKCLSYHDPYIAEKVLQRIEAAGIDRSRIAIFEPTATWKDHLSFYNLIDYALDTTYWSSATTGFDALGMGVPLLAIQGDTIAARMSSSLVTHLGRQEWLATKPEDYARLGQQISSEFMEVRGKKGHLQSEVQHSSLFDGPDLARSLEKALLQVLENPSSV